MSPGLEQLTKKQLAEKYEASQFELFLVKEELAKLRRMLFSSKSERFIPAVPDKQLSLDLGLEQPAVTETKTETITFTRRKSERKEKPARQPIPAHIPRVDIYIPRPEGTEGWKAIGQDISEELEYQPAKIYAKRSIRDRLVNPANEDDGVKIAELPSRIIPKGIAGPGLLAHIILSKYVDHLPIYRQIEIFRRQGIDLNDSTVNDWMMQVHKQLDPLYITLRRLLLDCGYVQGDDTGIVVLEKPPLNKKKDKKQVWKKRMKGFFWAWHSPENKWAYFEYYPGRGAIAAEDFLKDYQGFLQTDGYAAYERFDKREGITLTGCMTHARRKFHESLQSDKVNAEKALMYFQQLYAIERIAKEQNLKGEARKKFRDESQARAVIEEMHQWVKEEYPTVTPKSPIGVAMTYFLNRYKYLVRYFDDGRLEIDNNFIENSIRPIALGRKNYLFVGSHEGGKRAALFYSLLGCCKKAGLDPFQWLRDVLTRLPEHSVNQLEDLLPHKWKQQVFDVALPENSEKID